MVLEKLGEGVGWGDTWISGILTLASSVPLTLRTSADLDANPLANLEGAGRLTSSRSTWAERPPVPAQLLRVMVVFALNHLVVAMRTRARRVFLRLVSADQLSSLSA